MFDLRSIEGPMGMEVQSSAVQETNSKEIVLASAS